MNRPYSPGFIHGLLAATVAGLTLAGCNYSFSEGAGLPPHVRTVAILPFENESDRFELTQELHETLLRQLPRALGLTLGGEESADAVISGAIQAYDLQAPLYQRGRSAQQSVQVLQRQVTMRLRVQILDRANYTILWEQGVRCAGQYLEASETEEVARMEAIELCVQEIVDGAQSNW